MDAGLPPHIDDLERLTRRGQRRGQHIFRFPQKRKNAPVVIPVPAVIHQTNPSGRLQYTGDGIDFRFVASFAEIRHTFDDFHVDT